MKQSINNLGASAYTAEKTKRRTFLHGDKSETWLNFTVCTDIADTKSCIHKRTEGEYITSNCAILTTLSYQGPIHKTSCLNEIPVQVFEFATLCDLWLLQRCVTFTTLMWDLFSFVPQSFRKIINRDRKRMYDAFITKTDDIGVEGKNLKHPRDFNLLCKCNFRVEMWLDI